MVVGGTVGDQARLLLEQCPGAGIECGGRGAHGGGVRD